MYRPIILLTDAEILNPLSDTAGPHTCLPATLLSRGMLALGGHNSKFMWVTGVKVHVLSRGFPCQRMTSMAITMLLVPEMEHMGGYHVII